MNLVFSALPSHGHIYPLIPLALAALDRGHDVLFATTPEFHSTLHAFGVPVAPAGIGFREAFERSQQLAASQGAPPAAARTAMFASIFPRAFADDLRPLLTRIRADVMVHEAGNVGAFLAAKSTGVAGICHGFGRFPTRAELLGNPIAERATEDLARYASTLGVSLPSDMQPGYGDPYLDIFPPSLQTIEQVAAQNRIPMRPVPVNEPVGLPRWVLERDVGRPLVYLTLGTVFGQAEVLRKAIAGLASLDIDVLVATGPRVEPQALGDVPANIKLSAWVPQADLLSHVTVAVHHGGSGTTLASLSAGLPQLLLPQAPVHGLETVVAAGAAELLRHAEFSADAVAANVQRLIAAPRYRAAARALAAEIARMPAPAEIVPLLEGLRHR